MQKQAWLTASKAVGCVDRPPMAVGSTALVPCTIAAQPRPSLADLGLERLGMAHDLANLLQVVASAVELIDRGIDRAPKDEMRRLSRAALSTIDRAGKLGRRILDLSATPSSSGQVVDLCKVIAKMHDAILLAAGPALRVELQLPERVPAVFCDPREFELAVLNLVGNARDATPAGGTVAISVAADLRGDNETPSLADARVIFCVADTGCGMSAAMVREAFRPFFTTKPVDRGTGLGLAMVDDFARRFGATAGIDSEPGAGTSVFIAFPAFVRLV